MEITIKNIIFRALSFFYSFLARISCKTEVLPTETEAEEIISKYGYNNNLFQDECSHLQECSIDMSIVVPVYNSEKYLGKCLTSLLNQNTKYQYEIVCVNDGSTDGSLDIIYDLKQRYNDKIVICSQENGGIAAARNKGIELAKGVYIGFVDNDDTVSTNYVEEIVSQMMFYGADMLQTGHQRVKADGTILYKVCKTETRVLENDNSIDYINELSGFVWAGAYRKSMFENVRFVVGTWHEDMITKLILGRLSKKTIILKECLYNYTLHETNSSKTLWNTSLIKALDQLYLPIFLYHISNNVLKIKCDVPLNCMIIHELCMQLPNRISGLPTDISKAVFVIARNFLIEHNVSTSVELNRWNMMSMAIHSGNYSSWKYLAYSEKYYSKIV